MKFSHPTWTDMPAKSAMTVSLTPELAEFIAGKVASGHYRSSSEVVRAALRLLEQQDRAPDSRPRRQAGGTRHGG